MTEPFQAAVVGVGHLGRHHARIYADMEGVDLACVVDVDEGTAREVAERHGARAVADLRAIPDDVRLASIATPTHSHYEVARHLLDRGISLLVEKPLVQDLSQGEDLVRRARSTGAVLQVGHVERFNPACRAIERLAVEPRFIDSQRISPFTFRSRDIGVVLDLMIHDLDLILHIVGSEVKHVDAVGVSVLGQEEDIANARLEFENGCVANLTSSRVSMKVERKVRVFAPDCYASLDFGARRGVVYRRARGASETRDAIEDVDPRTIADPKAFVFGDFIKSEQIAMDDDEPLALEIGSFVRAVRDRTAPVVSGYDALRALRLAHRVLEEIGRYQERSREFLADHPVS